MTCSRITRKCRRVASSRFKRSRKSALKSKWGRRANKRQTFSLSDDFVVFRCLAARLWSREVDETGGCREGAPGALCTSLPQVPATTGKTTRNACLQVDISPPACVFAAGLRHLCRRLPLAGHCRVFQSPRRERSYVFTQLFIQHIYVRQRSFDTVIIG